MTTLSTTQLIEAMRTVAVAAETEQGREKLNPIANRMEMLVAANAGMDLQLNSIRTALNIPVNTSVQAGVIAETSRLNDEVLSLRSELSESVALANKLRRTAKEHQEENQQLRTGLATYDGKAIMVAEPIGEIDLIELFARAIPPAISQKITVTDDMAMAFHRATTDGDVGSDDVSDIKIGLNAALCNISAALPYAARLAVSKPVRPIGVIEAKAQGTDTYTLKCFYRPEGTSNLVGQKVYAAPPASQPYTVPDELTERLFSMRQQAILDGSYTETGEWENLVCDVLKARDACRAAMLQKNHSGDVADKVNSPAIPDGWVLVPAKANAAMVSAAGRAAREYMEEYGGNSPQVIYQAMLAAAQRAERKDGDAVSRELMARGVEQAASGFHEKAFVAFEGSNEPGLYIRAQLQLLAQQLRDGDA
ncbi:hypothetical protein [Pectobacterium versatile]|uniref:hypothetical protein n=1 Tax=Pectobacterium versatile TaxID=2488639 RepID=UPI001BB2E600|nr:hypothetical protein [Pectobacterium versatile]